MKGQFIVREDIVLASAAARPATLLLASTTLPALQKSSSAEISAGNAAEIATGSGDEMTQMLW